MMSRKKKNFCLPIAAVGQESGGVLDCVVEHHFTNAPLPLGTGWHVVDSPSRTALFAPGGQVLQHFGALQQCIRGGFRGRRRLRHLAIPNGGDVATVMGVYFVVCCSFLGFLHLMPSGRCIHRKLTF